MNAWDSLLPNFTSLTSSLDAYDFIFDTQFQRTLQTSLQGALFSTVDGKSDTRTVNPSEGLHNPRPQRMSSSSLWDAPHHQMKSMVRYLHFQKRNWFSKPDGYEYGAGSGFPASIDLSLLFQPHVGLFDFSFDANHPSQEISRQGPNSRAYDSYINASQTAYSIHPTPFSPPFYPKYLTSNSSLGSRVISRRRGNQAEIDFELLQQVFTEVSHRYDPFLRSTLNYILSSKFYHDHAEERL